MEQDDNEPREMTIVITPMIGACLASCMQMLICRATDQTQMSLQNLQVALDSVAAIEGLGRAEMGRFVKILRDLYALSPDTEVAQGAVADMDHVLAEYASTADGGWLT
jgi:hypothetical protein